ncbi:MAG TPA: hypothetical protein VNO70_00815 [Blastocatellia bacterium]|nr:hypothetical protein [Blastocatellia bacterium]
MILALLAAESESRAGTPRAHAASPELSLDKTRHDFGDVFAGEELTAAFQVTNRGDAPLRLSETPLPIVGSSRWQPSPEMLQGMRRLIPVAAPVRRAAPS